MRIRKKFGLGLVVAALAALAVSVSVASASTPSYTDPSDPQTTNIPYLAWVGEQVRVEKCVITWDHQLTDAQTSDIRAKLSISFPGQFTVEDWTGVNEVNAGPKWLNGTAGPSGSSVAPLEVNQRGICWSAHLSSQKPGMAVVKLSVSMEVLLSIKADLESDAATSDLALQLDNVSLFHDVLLKHQFLVIFMTAKAPTLYEVKGSDYFGGWGVADPLGDGIFTPWYEQGIDTFPGYGCHDNTVTEVGADQARFRCHFNDGIYGLVKADVKGTFPMGLDYSGMFKDDVVTLPDQWADLANKLAFDDFGPNGGIPGSAPNRWDIHDNDAPGHALFTTNNGLSDSKGENPDHNVNSGCDGGTNKTTDAVDNCLGGGKMVYSGADGASTDFYGEHDWQTNIGPFSSIFGLVFPAIGPFDPVRASETLLSDGNLGPEDAPMPALRVDVKLSAASVGALDAVDKDDIYVKDPTQADGYPHNLYAPFYKSFIPAASPGSGNSGVAGSFANNFPGFLNDGVYDFWNIKGWVWRDGDNGCRAPFSEQRREMYASDADYNGRDNRQGGLYPLPTGWSHISVYTDEHGQAFVKFLPYRGLFLTPDDQGNCDLTGNGKRLMGTADISATSIYPDQPVGWEQSNKTSNTLHKVVNHLATKTLQCVHKDAIHAYCVETVLDFNGDPVKGVKVQFRTSQHAGTVSFAKYDTFGDPLPVEVLTDTSDNNPLGKNFNTTDQWNGDKASNGDWAEVKTGENGQAGVLIESSNSLCVNVVAENLLTANVKGNAGVMRDVKVDPTGTLSCGPNYDDGSTPGASGGDTGGGSNNGGSTGGGSNTGGSSSGGSSSGGSSSGGSATQSTVVSLGGPVIQAQPVLSATQTAVVAQATAKLFSVKVLQTQAGRFLVVNVKGTAKTAKIRIAVLGKNGKVLRTIVRTVPTNRAFKIVNFKLAKTAVAVKASVTA